MRLLKFFRFLRDILSRGSLIDEVKNRNTKLYNKICELEELHGWDKNVLAKFVVHTRSWVEVYYDIENNKPKGVAGLVKLEPN